MICRFSSARRSLPIMRRNIWPISTPSQMQNVLRQFKKSGEPSNFGLRTFGGLRLDKIRRIHINSFIEKRQAEKIVGTPRSNLDIIVLRNVLKRAIDDQWIKTCRRKICAR